MMRIVLMLSFLMGGLVSIAQDPVSLLEEGRRLEQKLKDDDALAKYREVLVIQASNLKANVRCADVSCAIGARKASPEEKLNWYKTAFQYAQTALKIDSNSADAHHITAVVYGKITEMEKKPEAIIAQVKAIKMHAEKAIQLNPDFGKAYHVLGKWHLEMVSLNAFKKAALKVIGKTGEGNIETAIANFEKCKKLEPYYCLNFYDLARAYQFNKQYEKGIAVLEQLKKLPTRRQDDVQIKADGEKLLQQMQ